MMTNVFKSTKRTDFAWRLAFFAMICAVVLTCPVSVFADGGFGSGMAENVSGESDYIAQMLKKLAALIGLGLVLASIVMFATMKKTQTPASIPTAMLIAGIILVGIMGFIGMGSATFFGSADTDSLQQMLR